jgi:hypothetical protein
MGMVQKRPISGNTGATNSAQKTGIFINVKSRNAGKKRKWLFFSEAESGSLKPGEAQQFQPVRMALPSHQFRWTFPDALRPLATQESAVIEKELK